MPIYEFQCPACGSRESVYARSMTAELTAPRCPNTACRKRNGMVRAISRFAQHRTEADQVAEAEAKYGKEVDAAMGPMPDIGRMARRYSERSKDLRPREGP